MRAAGCGLSGEAVGRYVRIKSNQYGGEVTLVSQDICVTSATRRTMKRTASVSHPPTVTTRPCIATWMEREWRIVMR